jgi:putative endonuclease
MNTREKGILGENTAENYLIDNGYMILERNFSTRIGEIDLIAKKHNMISFLEVKSWSRGNEADLEYVIGKRKQHRMIEVSKWYMAKNLLWADNSVSYDVIFIDGRNDDVKHIQHAFDEV